MDPATLRQAQIELLTTGLGMTEGRDPEQRAIFLLAILNQASVRFAKELTSAPAEEVPATEPAEAA